MGVKKVIIKIKDEDVFRVQDIVKGLEKIYFVKETLNILVLLKLHKVKIMEKILL